jgi:ubiquilin
MKAKIIVSMGARLEFDDVDEALTVRELKQRVAGTVTGLGADEQRAIYRGRVLIDSQTLAQISFRDGDSIHIVRGAVASEPVSASSLVPTSSVAPGGMGGMDGDSMRTALNNPLVQQIMNNPETLRAIIFANPQMRELAEANPEINHILSDPSVLRQTVETARNPELMREMMRSSDRALSNMEAHPEGFNALRRMYTTIQEPLRQIAPGGDLALDNSDETTYSLQSDTPNTDALPNPFVARAPLSQRQPPFMPSFGGLGGFGERGGVGAGMGPGSGALPSAQSPAPPNALAGAGGAGGQPAIGGGQRGPGGGGGMFGAMSQNPMLMQSMLEAMQDPTMQNFLGGRAAAGAQQQPPVDMASLMRARAERQQAMMQMLMPANQLMGGGHFGAMGMAQPPAGMHAPGTTPLPAGAEMSDDSRGALEARYESEIGVIAEMGFGERAKILDALIATGGNINAAIARLVG